MTFLPHLLLVTVAALAARSAADHTTTYATPSAWVSVQSDGSFSTVTPSVLTNSAGSPTATLDGKPTSTSAAASESASASASSTSTSESDSNVITYCDASKSKAHPPFCAPSNGSSWYVGGNYYVTWDNTFWNKSSKVVLNINYEVAGDSGVSAGTWTVANALGFLNIKPEKSWLINQTSLDEGYSDSLDNQTLYLTLASDDASSSSSSNVKQGPTILLTSKPTAPSVDTSPSNRPPVSTLGLAIGLPLVVAFIFATVCGLHFCMRHQRRVGPIAIGGGRRHFRRRAGYSGRKERRDKFAAARGAEYRDVPEEEAGVLGAQAQSDRDWELASVHGK